MISARLISIGIGYIAGIICATLFRTDALEIVFWGLLVAGGFAASWALFREFNWKENHIILRIAPLLIASFSAGNIITNNFLYSDNPGVLFFKNLPDRAPVILRGIISAETETRSDTRLDVRLRTSELKRMDESKWVVLKDPIDVKISVNFPSEDAEKQKICAKIADGDSYGYQIEILGRFERSSASANPGGFDYETFLMSEGFVASVKVFDKIIGQNDYIKIIEEKRGNPLIEAALSAKKSFISTIQKTIMPPESFFVSGATLGTRFSIKKQEYNGKLIEDSFRHSGVGHVLAVSGLHVSVVSLLLYSLLRLTRIPPKYFAPFLILLLFAFAFLTGARPSSLRATIMNSLVIIMFVYGGGGISQSAYTGLAFSSFLILLRRPMALYSAGFLLSFGAVLSLVMLTTPFDKLLRTLRGGRLLGGLLWFALCIYAICTSWELFLRWESIAFFGLLFYLLINLGELLNKFFPAMLVINPDKLPTVVRIFMAAQLGIQFGMMVPLSSFFFGQMPIAGIFVNMLAIPLIGVIVQLGLLGGILGSMPFVGEYFAIVIGAANYLVAKFFIWLAYLGSELLPFPVTPIPSLRWLILYYVIIAIFASSVLWIRKLENLLFVLHSKFPTLLSKGFPIVGLSALVIFVVLRANIPKSSSAELHILAESSVPVVCISRDDYRRGAVLINGGHSFFAKSSLKNFLLKKNNIFIEEAFVSGHAPEFGTAALAELARDFSVLKVYYPNFHEPVDGAKPPLFAKEAYYDAIGENKILKSALEGKGWAIRYYDSYKKLAKVWKEGWILFNAPAEFTIDNEIKMEYLTSIYRSYPIVSRLIFENATILIVPDIGSTKKIPKEKLKADILVLAGPSKIAYKTYLKSLSYLLKDSDPKTVVLCVDKNFSDKNLIEVVENASDICAKRKGKFFRTDETGALSIKLDNNKLSDRIEMYLAK